MNGFSHVYTFIILIAVRISFINRTRLSVSLAVFALECKNSFNDLLC